jgi:hypothetical protein
VRQQRRAERSMRRIPQASQRRGQTMHYAQPGVGQRQAAEQARQRHLAVRIALITRHAFLKFIPRKLVHQLGEDRLSVVHSSLSKAGLSEIKFKSKKHKFYLSL